MSTTSDDYESLIVLRTILESKKWIFAKTMKSNPHFYSLRRDWDDGTFNTVVSSIRKMGEKVLFYGKEYTQLRIDDWRYWTMGAPVNETCLINRAKTPIRADYDDVAWKYDRFYDKPEYIEENSRIAVILQEDLQLQGKILDVGCGTGILLDLFVINPKNYLGVDPSSKMLAKFKLKHPQHTCWATKFESVTNLKFNSLVALFGAASYVIPSAWQRMRYLMPGGRYFLMFYSDEYIPKIIHLSRFSCSQALEFLPSSHKISSFGNYFVVQGHV